MRSQRSSAISVIAAAGRTGTAVGPMPVGRRPVGYSASPAGEGTRPSPGSAGRRSAVLPRGAEAPSSPVGFGLAEVPPAAAAEPVRRVVRDLRPRARVMTLVSGKGGVGKTNLAVNLSISLAAAGRRVLLVDADLGLANVDLLLGQRPRGDLGHVLAGRMPLAEIIQEGPAGIRWIPGASHMPAVSGMDERRREALIAGLTALETGHDYLIIDAPAGIGQGVLNLARQADELLLVTTPEPTAMMDAYLLLKAAAAAGVELLGRVRLIVNMVTHRSDAQRVHGRIQEAARRFLGLPVELLGYVSCDGHVGRAVQKQEPLVLAFPHSQAAWCVRRLAVSVLEGAGGPEKGRFAFFRRLANLFAAGSR